MGADALLVQGAGQVAASQSAGKLAMSEAMQDTADFLADGISKVIQARNKEFNSIMKSELERDPGLTDEEWDDLYKDLEGRRMSYVYGNKKFRIKAEKDLAKEASERIKIEDGKKNIAKKGTDDDGFKKNEEFVASPAGKDIEGIITGENKIVYGVNGRPGYMVSKDDTKYVDVATDGPLIGDPTLSSYQEAWDDGRFTVSDDGKTKTDEYGNQYPNTDEGYKEFIDASEKWWKGEHDKNTKSGGKTFFNLNIDSQTGKQSTNKVWMSIDQVENLIEENSVDVQSKKIISEVVNTTSNNAGNIKAGENNEFNYDATRESIKTQVVGKGNIRSLAKDEIIPGRSFYKDMQEALVSSSYEDLGIDMTQEDAEKLDPTPRTPISKKDAKVIADKLMADEKMLGDYLTDYYTKYMEQNHNNSLKGDVAIDFSSKGTFDEAFSAARKRFGSGKSFIWGGKKYSTNTAEEDENEFA